MISIKFNSFVKINHSCFILKGKNTFKEVEGLCVKINEFPDFDFFAHKQQKGKLYFWTITEAISGLRVTNYHKDFKSAQKAAIKELNKLSKSRLEFIIKEKVDNKFLSPRYRFLVNPNSVYYVATRKNNNKKSPNPREYRIQFLKE